MSFHTSGFLEKDQWWLGRGLAAGEPYVIENLKASMECPYFFIKGHAMLS
jgi:hypothetical protein